MTVILEDNKILYKLTLRKHKVIIPVTKNSGKYFFTFLRVKYKLQDTIN